MDAKLSKLSLFSHFTWHVQMDMNCSRHVGEHVCSFSSLDIDMFICILRIVVGANWRYEKRRAMPFFLASLSLVTPRCSHALTQVHRRGKKVFVALRGRFTTCKSKCKRVASRETHFPWRDLSSWEGHLLT